MHKTNLHMTELQQQCSSSSNKTQKLRGNIEYKSKELQLNSDKYMFSIST